jgi:hypothetical protein
VLAPLTAPRAPGSLDNNELGEEAGKAIADALPSLPQLQYL